jgi:hypothetical protein
MRIARREQHEARVHPLEGEKRAYQYESSEAYLNRIQ